MENGWARAGQMVRARRKELGRTQDQIKQSGGPSSALQRQVESGTYDSDMHPGVRRGYERALEWEMYSLDRVLEGLEPYRLGTVSTDTGEGLEPRTSVGAPDNDESEFEFLTRVREDLTAEEMDQLMKEATPYLEMLVRDIRRRHRDDD